MPRLPEPPPGLEARCDAILADLLVALVPIQSAYLAAHGRYWQGIVSHQNAPADGNQTAPDRSRRPTDQAESWADVGVALPATMELAAAVDTYAGPEGHGYTVHGIISIGNRTWLKSVAVGPETRSLAWTDVTSEGAP